MDDEERVFETLLQQEPMRQPGPNTLFITDRTIIVLDNVVMTRWDGHHTPGLDVYFAQGPHINLNKEEGLEFVEALINYYQGISEYTG